MPNFGTFGSRVSIHWLDVFIENLDPFIQILLPNPTKNEKNNS